MYLFEAKPKRSFLFFVAVVSSSIYHWHWLHGCCTRVYYVLCVLVLHSFTAPLCRTCMAFGCWQPQPFLWHWHLDTHTNSLRGYAHIWMKIVSHYANSKTIIEGHFAKCCGFFDNFTRWRWLWQWIVENKMNMGASVYVWRKKTQTKFAICENYNFHELFSVQFVKCFLFILGLEKERKRLEALLCVADRACLGIQFVYFEEENMKNEEKFTQNLNKSFCASTANPYTTNEMLCHYVHAPLFSKVIKLFIME